MFVLFRFYRNFYITFNNSSVISRQSLDYLNILSHCGLFLKERICSQREQILSFKSSSQFAWFQIQGRKRSVYKHCLSLKKGSKILQVYPIPLKVCKAQFQTSLSSCKIRLWSSTCSKCATNMHNIEQTAQMQTDLNTHFKYA